MRELIKKCEPYIIAYNTETGFYEIYEMVENGDFDLKFVGDTVKETPEGEGDITVRAVWDYDEQFNILKKIAPEIYSEQLEEYKAELKRKGYDDPEITEMIRDL